MQVVVHHVKLCTIASLKAYTESDLNVIGMCYIFKICFCRDLYRNKIRKIEPDSFKDLEKLHEL